MEWSKSNLDLVLVPTAILTTILYHVWLWHKVRFDPHQTDIGFSAAYRRRWVVSMMKDNEKKNILATQTLRNLLMGTTLMASTCVLICTGLAAVLSNTSLFDAMHHMDAMVYGARGGILLPLKYTLVFLLFLFAFVFYFLAVHLLNQACILFVNVVDGGDGSMAVMMPDNVVSLLNRGYLFNTVGNRVFYTGRQTLLWMYGPALVFFASLVMVALFYTTDVLGDPEPLGQHVMDHEQRLQQLRMRTNKSKLNFG